MAKTVQDKDYSMVTGLIDKVVEPQIRKILEEFNVVLATKNIRAGAELKWFFDYVEDDQDEEAEGSKKELKS